MTPAVAIRAATPADEPLLWEMLAYAAHMLPGTHEAARTDPFLARFVRGWGRDGDLGVVAEGTPAGPGLGAAWLRHLVGPEQSYPEADGALPELAIAVRPGHEGRGLGSALLSRLVALARPVYPGVVLSVRADNPARRLYERHGFQVTGEIVNRVGTRSYVMELPLRP